MWRAARPADDDAITRMCMALYREDPGPAAVPMENIQRTLASLCSEPYRGRVVVLDVDGTVHGYALLISFWSNELGGEACVVDEIYVDPAYRGRGYATRLFDELVARTGACTSSATVALALEVSPGNVRARQLYERMGFAGFHMTMRRRLRIEDKKSP